MCESYETFSTKNPVNNLCSSISLHDEALLDELAYLDHEKIPERVIHAKGAGASGYFEVTHDITNYCKAALFSSIGKKTPVSVRFSMSTGESGSAETIRETKGFAIKFYTEEGNWDLVGSNMPVFFIRDPFLFPSFIRSQKRNPINNLKTDQGIKNLCSEKASAIAAVEPDYATCDLYQAIERGDFPSWTMYIQVASAAEIENLGYNAFDVTKTWPKKRFPLQRIGKLVLDKNPLNYFLEVEQLAFSPGNMVPGIGPSPDVMLQRHRLGENFLNIYVNCPLRFCMKNIPKIGSQAAENSTKKESNLNFDTPRASLPNKSGQKLFLSVHEDSDRSNKYGDDYFQARIFYNKVLCAKGHERLAYNIAEHLVKTNPHLQKERCRIEGSPS